MGADLIHRDVEIKVLDGPYLVDGKPTSEAIDYYCSIVDRLDELRSFAADALLELYNRTWWTDEIGKLDRGGFMSRLTSPSVHLYDELGTALVYFDDGDMFAGHFIELSLEDGVPIDAQLVD